MTKLQTGKFDVSGQALPQAAAPNEQCAKNCARKTNHLPEAGDRLSWHQIRGHTCLSFDFPWNGCKGVLNATRVAPFFTGPPGLLTLWFRRLGQSQAVSDKVRSAYSWPATLLKVPAALEPIEVMAPKQTTTIRANITAYSTAVGPSSDFKKRLILEAKFFMVSLQFARPPGYRANKKQNVTAQASASPQPMARSQITTSHPRSVSTRHTSDSVCTRKVGQF